MRRKDREVTDHTRIADIIQQCHICRLGFYDNGEIYIVPLNFGYEIKDNTYTLYFHSAKQGRKIDLVKNGAAVGFEMDTGYTLVPSDTACGHSALYQSIIGSGTASIVHGEEKIYGLKLLMEHETHQKDWNFNEKMLNAVEVIKLTVTHFSCKEH